MKSWLTIDRHEAGLAPYSAGSADEVIRVYKSTVTFAGLTEYDNLPEDQWEKDAQLEADLASNSKGEAMETQTRSNVRRDHVAPGMIAERKEIKDDVSVLLQGNRLKINATVDADGIARLKQVLDKYEEILKLLQ